MTLTALSSVAPCSGTFCRLEFLTHQGSQTDLSRTQSQASLHPRPWPGAQPRSPMNQIAASRNIPSHPREGTSGSVGSYQSLSNPPGAQTGLLGLSCPRLLFLGKIFSLTGRYTGNPAGREYPDWRPACPEWLSTQARLLKSPKNTNIKETHKRIPVASLTSTGLNVPLKGSDLGRKWLIIPSLRRKQEELQFKSLNLSLSSTPPKKRRGFKQDKIFCSP